MRLERLDLLAFGGFTDRSLDLSAGPHRLHLIFGPNESGKSTTLRAITGLLYGIESRTQDNFLHSNAKIRVGGHIVDAQNGSLEFVRRKGNRNTLLNPDGSAQDEANLARFLTAIDKEIFERQFGLNHPRLNEGGQSISQGEGDLGEILFAAGAGLGQLTNIQQILKKKQSDLFLRSGANPAINKNLERLKQARREMKEALLKPADYVQRVQAYEQLAAETKELREQVQKRKTRLDRDRRRLEALPLVARRAILCEELKACEGIPILSKDFAERHRAADRKRMLVEEQRQRIENGLKDLQTEWDAISSDENALRHGQQITSLYERLESWKKTLRKLPDIGAEIDSLQRQIANDLKRINHDAATVDMESLEIPVARREAIQNLFNQYGGLNEKVSSAERTLKELQQQAEEAERSERGSAPPTDPQALAVVLEQIGQPQLLLDQLRTAEKNCNKRLQRAESELQKLDGFQGTLDEVFNLRIPSAAKIAEETKQLERLAKNLQHSIDQIHAGEEKLTEITDKLAAARGKQSLPSEADLAKLRQVRDDQLQGLGLKQDASGGEWAILGKAIADADACVDILRSEVQRVERRAQLEHEQGVLQTQLENLAEARQEADAAYSEAWRQWLDLWQQHGIRADQPAVMKDWVAAFDRLQQMHGDLDDAQLAVREAKQSVALAVNRLQTALRFAEVPAGSGLPEGTHTEQDLAPSEDDRPLLDVLESPHEEWLGDGEEPVHQSSSPEPPLEHPQDLIWLYTTAKHQLEQQRARFSDFQQQAQARQLLKSQLPRAERHLEECNAEMQTWRTHWKAATSYLNQSADLHPDSINRIIHDIDAVLRLNEDRARLEQQRDSIQRESDLFVNEVQDLLDLMELPADEDPAKSVLQLWQELNAQQTNHQQRASLRKQLEQSEQQKSQMQVDWESAETELKILIKEAGCERADDLSAVEQQALKRDQLVLERTSLDSHLQTLAGSGDLAAFVEMVETTDASELQDQVTCEEAELAEIDERLTEQLQRLGQLRSDVEAMDGRGAAAQAQQELQDSLAKIRRDAMDYATLRVADIALQQAIERYRETNQGPVLARAESLFARLTLNDYSGLRADFDERGRPVLVGLRGSDMVPVTAMSDGTADALYLSLRLASLESHLKRRGPFPLVLDDILIQFDDGRSAAALKILAELSQQTQVLFFTHHQHLLDLAKETLQPNEYHSHAL